MTVLKNIKQILHVHTLSQASDFGYN